MSAATMNQKQVPARNLSCGVISPNTRAPRPVPVIVDTDMGSDDWLALLLLFSCTSALVKAATISGTGISSMSAAVRNVRRLAAAIGKAGFIIGRGASAPLKGHRQFPPKWRSRADRFLGISLPNLPIQRTTASAVDVIGRSLHAQETKTTVIALAPLTNLAQSLQQSADLRSKIERIFIMGGALYDRGNAPGGHAEWNMYVDPVAASVVLRSGCEITLVPLDATNQVPVTLEFYQRLRSEKSTPAAELAFAILSAELDEIRAGEYFFWDSLAVATALVPNLTTVDTLRVRVLADIDQSSAGTLAAVAHGHGNEISVCTRVDRTRFEDWVISVLNGKARPT